MATNLPSPLSHAQATLLRTRIQEAITRFTIEQEADPAQVALASGFIMAHLAATMGVLDASYRDWLTAPRPEGSPDVTPPPPGPNVSTP